MSETVTEYLTNSTDLKTVADAIRTKTGGTENLTYPDGFASAIAGIGSDCNATAGDILQGKTALAGSAKVTGNIQSLGATTYYPSGSDQTINSGKYISGNQTIKAVTTNLSAANIKKGFTAKVGYSGSAGAIASINGSCVPVSLNLTQNSSCYVPFMFITSDAFPVGFYWVGGGWRCQVGGASSKQFVVPCPIRMTYYESDTSGQATMDFAVNTVYTLSPKNATAGTASIGSTQIWKIVKWEAI